MFLKTCQPMIPTEISVKKRQNLCNITKIYDIIRHKWEAYGVYAHFSNDNGR